MMVYTQEDVGTSTGNLLPGGNKLVNDIFRASFRASYGRFVAGLGGRLLESIPVDRALASLSWKAPRGAEECGGPVSLDMKVFW